MMEALQEDDETLQFIPWKECAPGKESDMLIISSPSDFPISIKDFKPMFSPDARISSFSMIWFKMRWALTKDPFDLTSQFHSNKRWWYDDNECTAYPMVVQDSEDSVEIAHLAYTGNFTDTARLTRVIKEACLAPPYEQAFRIGCQSRLTKDITVPREFNTRPFTMKIAALVTVECDKTESPFFTPILK